MLRLDISKAFLVDIFSIQDDDDYDQPQTSNEVQSRKRPFVDVSSESDLMPAEYKHIRLSERKVRPEVYETLDKLKSTWHMSESQAAGAIVEVGNGMFGRNFKMANEAQHIDNDTMPDPHCVRKTGDAITAMTLAQIAKEVLESDQNSNVVYSDDGSKKQGAGSFIVQGITVNGKHRPLPMLSIDTETRENLADLKVLTYQMLEKSSGISAKDLFSKIDFVMTDQTSHNQKVEELVCEQLDIEEQYREKIHLFCNVHPSLMFLRKLSSFWSEIEARIGQGKIQAVFLVDATNRKDSITEQMIDCCKKLINHDHDHKPWNYSVEFDIHISPNKNMSMTLKDQRFDRLTLCCATLLHHYHELETFLSEMTHVTNQLTSIARSFQEIEFMPVLLALGALVGVHLINPFLHVTMAQNASYENLIPLFQQLYEDLKGTDPQLLLSTTKPGFSCFTQDVFDASLYKPEVMSSLDAYTGENKSYLLLLWKGLLPKLADGFDLQKGHIFGFGEGKKKPPDHRIDTLPIEQLKGVPVHNLAEERSVGFINYELRVRGATQLQSASSTLIKNKNADLLKSCKPGTYKEFMTAAQNLKDMRLKWNDKQKELAKERLTKKAIANVSIERTKCKDLELLKSQGGPFTTPAQVDIFMNSKSTEKEKCSRLYVEVRYAKNTSLLLPKSSQVFRLKKNHKNLAAHEYASNMKSYLTKFQSDSVATMDDFHAAILSL